MGVLYAHGGEIDFEVAAVGVPMITSPFVAGLAKVVAVGALMAAGAGGIYVVASTQSDEGEPQVVAETPTPSSADTSTPELTPPGTEPVQPADTPTPDATATAMASVWEDEQPPAPGDPMLIGGSVWVNAHPVGSGTVDALINGKVCVSAEILRLGQGAVQTFFMYVPSASDEPGCGETGSVVEFRIDGVTLDQRVEFQGGIHPPVTFTSGPAFTQITGIINLTHDYTRQILVQPMIDGKLCGYDLGGGAFGGPQRGYHVVVYSQELEPGCGAQGKIISLELVLVNDDGSEAPLGVTIDAVGWESSTMISADPWTESISPQ